MAQLAVTADGIVDATTVGKALIRAASEAAARAAVSLDTGDSPTFAAVTATGVISSNAIAGEIRSYQYVDGPYLSLKTAGNKSGLFRSNTDHIFYYHTSTGDTHIDATFTASSDINFDIQGTTKLQLLGEGVLKHKVGTSAEWYNLDTDASNYECVRMRWDANIFKIHHEYAGAGADRDLDFAARQIIFRNTTGSAQFQITTTRLIFGLNAQPTSDGGTTIGSSSLRFREIHGIRYYANDPAAITTSEPMFGGSQEWNDAGVTFEGFTLDITNTLADSASVAFAIKDAGTTKFHVDEIGGVSCNGLELFNTGVAGAYLRSGSQILYCRFGTGDDRLGFSQVNKSLYLSKDYAFGISDSDNVVGSTIDTRWYRDAAQTWATRDGVNPCAVNIYNTYTDASNYERVGMWWDSNTFKIETQALGTGTLRNLQLSGGTTNRARLTLEANLARFEINGVFQFQVASDYVKGYSNTAFAIKTRTISSATDPVFLPGGVTDPDTGIGHVGADELSLIAGGVNSATVNATGMKFPVGRETNWYNLDTDATTWEALRVYWDTDEVFLKADVGSVGGDARNLVLSTAFGGQIRFVGQSSGSNQICEWGLTSGGSVLRLTYNNLTPSANGAIKLGNDTLRWNDAYFTDMHFNSILKGDVGGTSEWYYLDTDGSNYTRSYARYNGIYFELGTEGAGTGGAGSPMRVTSGGSILQLDSAQTVDFSYNATNMWFFALNATDAPLVPQNDASASLGRAANRIKDLYIRDKIIHDTGTITASTPHYAGTQTWNDAGVTFEAFTLDVTNTASAAASTLFDFKAAGTSVLSMSALTTAPILTLAGTQGATAVEIVNASGWRKTAITQGGLQLALNAVVEWDESASFATGTGNPQLHRDGDGQITLRNGTQAQGFGVHNTYTDATTWEALRVYWDTNICYIETDKGSVGGTKRHLRLDGYNIQLKADGSAKINVGVSEISVYTNFRPAVNNSYDFGTSSLGWKDSFFTGVMKHNVGATSEWYNLDTDATTYERGFIRWDTDVLKIGNEKGSVGGTQRTTSIYGSSIRIINGTGGNLANFTTSGFYSYESIFANNAGLDIGQSGTPWEDAYFDGIIRQGVGGTTEWYNLDTDATTWEALTIHWESDVCKIEVDEGSVGGTFRNMHLIAKEVHAYSTGDLQTQTTNGKFKGYSNTAFAIQTRTVASATVPVFLPGGTSDPDTGIGHVGANELSLIAGGVNSATVNATGMKFPVGRETNWYALDTDASNYARLEIEYGVDQAGEFTIQATKAGTGTVKQVNFGDPGRSHLRIGALSSNASINWGDTALINTGNGYVHLYAPLSPGVDGDQTLGTATKSWGDSFFSGIMKHTKTTEDEAFTSYNATADADSTSAISTLTTSGATTHHIQVDINGTKAWIAVSTNVPS